MPRFGCLLLRTYYTQNDQGNARKTVRLLLSNGATLMVV